MNPTVLMCSVLLAGSLAAADLPVEVIPRPARIAQVAGQPFTLAAGTRIHARGDGAVAAVGARLVETLAALTGVPTVTDAQDGDGIVLAIDASLAIDGPAWAAAEGYRLESGAQRVTITARSAHGLFNGAMTLAQLASPGDGGWRIPAVTIADMPRFPWRGLMLDCGRHFFTVAEVCRFLDQMALHKFNTLHWHLTEDQGWRIEVKRFPKLTTVGAWRAESPVMGERRKGDGQPYGGFYTQDDLRAVVAYAAARHITVVPELEMPGHSTASIAAYPELGNNDIPGWQAPATGTAWGVIARTLAPKEETFRFIAGVFDEILPIFPGAFVHIGADEAPKNEWKKSPFAQQVIKDQGLKDEHGLQSWFVRRVEKLLTERGKRLIGWDEIQEGGLSPTATMMVWRDWKWAKLALEHGNDIVMAPKSHTYLDYGQGPNPGGPVHEVIGGKLPLEKVYAFEPIPAGTPDERHRQVLGCQGQLWSEYIWSTAKLDYMTWPRACALAEAAWTPATGKDWAAFEQRLRIHEARLDRLRVNYRRSDGAPAQPTQSMDRTPRPPVK